MTTQQPEALRWADKLEKCWADPGLQLKAAAELRRLHEVNQELLAALKAQMLVTTWEEQEAANELARAAIKKQKGQRHERRRSRRLD